MSEELLQRNLLQEPDKKLVNPTDLAKQIWQDIWSVSGATPENCLYTFVELFIFKYLSDLGILQGTVPVYSASKFPETVDYGYVQDKLDGIKYFENCLTWNIDGSIGKVHYRKGRFSLSEKVIPLIVRDALKDKLDWIFLKYSIENEFANYAFGFSNKAGKGKIKHIEIPIPINQSGEFDLEIQMQIAKRYEKLEELKRSLSAELEELGSLQVSLVT